MFDFRSMIYGRLPYSTGREQVFVGDSQLEFTEILSFDDWFQFYSIVFRLFLFH